MYQLFNMRMVGPIGVFHIAVDRTPGTFMLICILSAAVCIDTSSVFPCPSEITSS